MTTYYDISITVGIPDDMDADEMLIRISDAICPDHIVDNNCPWDWSVSMLPAESA